MKISPAAQILFSIFAALSLLTGTTTLATQETERRKKHFLFAGQSNMEGQLGNGHYKDPQRLVRFDRIMDIVFNETLNYDDKMDQVVQILQATPGGDRRTPLQTYQDEFHYLMTLYYHGLLDEIRLPSNKVQCSFFRGHFGSPWQGIDHPNTAWATDEPLSPYVDCGIPYGPELMFGHTMQSYNDDEFAIKKVAVGGSELTKHWMKELGPNGGFFSQLNDTIHSINAATDSWDAIVWWQGDTENATNAANYEANLTQFIADVRREVFVADGKYQHEDDIPVVIVQVGYWSQEVWRHGKAVALAQGNFAVNDWNTFMVPTYDLSRDIHYDEVAQLIVGDEIAMALEPVIQSNWHQ